MTTTTALDPLELDPGTRELDVPDGPDVRLPLPDEPAAEELTHAEVTGSDVELESRDVEEPEGSELVELVALVALDMLDAEEPGKEVLPATEEATCDVAAPEDAPPEPTYLQSPSAQTSSRAHWFELLQDLGVWLVHAPNSKKLPRATKTVQRTPPLRRPPQHSAIRTRTTFIQPSAPLGDAKPGPDAHPSVQQRARTTRGGVCVHV